MSKANYSSYEQGETPEPEQTIKLKEMYYTISIPKYCIIFINHNMEAL